MLKANEVYIFTNIIVVCKKYYIEVIISELMNTSGGQNTYCTVANDAGSIIDKYLKYMKTKGITVPLIMEQLPDLYWLPKLHKTPYGSRFIAASSRCTTKPLSGLLTSCLSTVLVHFKEYCNGIFANTGINCYWVIDNSQQVLIMFQILIVVLVQSILTPLTLQHYILTFHMIH